MKIDALFQTQNNLIAVAINNFFDKARETLDVGHE